MNICANFYTKLEFTRVSKYPNMTSLNPKQFKSLLWCSNQSMVGWLYVIKRWTIWMTSSCIFLKNYFEQSLIIHRHFFLSMVEICVYNSYILWLTKLKCVCQTDHLFTKQRASELMIWLRYAIEVKYFLYCADIVLPTAYLESQIPESFFFFKINVNV